MYIIEFAQFAQCIHVHTLNKQCAHFAYLFDLLPGHLCLSTVEAKVMVEQQEVWLLGATGKNAIEEVVIVNVISWWMVVGVVVERVKGESEGLSVGCPESESTSTVVVTRRCVHLSMHVIA